MSIPSSCGPEPANGALFDEDLVFAALRHPARRKLLFALAKGGPQTAEDLMILGRGRGKCNLREHYVDNTAKNLKLMVDAGMVVQQVNPSDGRRLLHALSPALKVTVGEEKTAFDFGLWVVRLGADGN